MGAVVELRPKPVASDPHAEGEAFCYQCGHEWHAVVPVGTVELECPQCHTMKGLFKFGFIPAPGTIVRACNCGCQLFWITPDGHQCPNCGTYQRY